MLSAKLFRIFVTFIGAALACLVLLVGNAPAQVTTEGMINGVVTDSSGAVVLQAQITIRNEDTGVGTPSHTNGAGAFAVPGIVPGRYTVTAEKPGFQRYVENGLIVHPSLVTTVNPVLQIGKSTSQVTISATAVRVQTATPEVSNEVSAMQVSSLPLNGRNFQSLSALMPGVTNAKPGVAMPQGGFYMSNTMSTNGMGTSSSVFYIDGIIDMGLGGLGTIDVTPNPDAIQEVRVLQSNFGVPYSLDGTSVVVVQTKSGTSTFHGTAFEYLRNDALNARNFFSPTVPTLRQNIFGFTFGGPLYIPGHYNTHRSKTFFFGSMQWSRINSGSTLTGATPTAAMRQGTFTSAITDPTTGQPFSQTSPGVWQIPANRLNQGGLALMSAWFPLPNNPGGGFNNYINSTPQIDNQRLDEIKIDHNFSDRLVLTGEFLDNREVITLPDNPSSGPFATIGILRHTPQEMGKLQLTQTLSPAMVNTTSLTTMPGTSRFYPTGITQLSQVPAFKESLPFQGGPFFSYLPQLAFSQGWSGVGTSTNAPQPHAGNDENSFSDDWSYLKGKHYFQAGLQYMRWIQRQFAFAQVEGKWSFTGQYTGNAIADYLLGDPASLAQSSNRENFWQFGRVWSPYFQDRWQASRHLTLTLGLRYTHLSGLWQPQGTLSNFVPSLYNPANAPIVANNGTITPTANYNPLNGLGLNGENGVPLTLTANPKNNWSPSVGFAWDVFGDGKTALRGGYSLVYIDPFQDFCSCYNNPPITGSISLVGPGFPAAVGTGTVAPQGAPGLSALDTNRYGMSPVETYSLSIEHQFRGWFTSIAGAGNIARHLPMTLNQNQPLPEGGYNFNPVINAGTTFTYLDGLYQGYGAISTTSQGGSAYWNALEVNVRHPVGHSLFLSLAYTWQHDLSTAGGGGNNLFNLNSVENTYDFNADYGNTALNVPQVFTVSGIWSLPFFKDAAGLKGMALRGWHFTDMTTAQSGSSLIPGLATSHPGLATRANAVAGVSTIGPKAPAEFFNTQAFSAPDPGYFGNAARGSITGPGFLGFDMSLDKDFHITERNVIQFRAEAFNAFNLTNFNAVQTNLGAGNFGHTTAAADPRIFEFALRYQF